MSSKSPARRALAIAAAFVVGALAAAPAAPAAPVFDGRVAAAKAKKRTCHARLQRAGTAGVAQRTVRLSEPSLLRARLTGRRGDWDLGVFHKASGRSLAGSAGPRSIELAEGFAPADAVVIQACRRKGTGRSARLRVAAYAIPTRQPGEEREVAQVVEVSTPTPRDKQKLQGLGLDLTEHGDAGHLEVVLHGASDAAKLRSAGFRYEVEIADLAARQAQVKLADARYARATQRSSLPSGRDGYRRLADFEAELKTMAEQNPSLVKLVVLPHRTLEGRQVFGVEISENVQQADGKPVFVQLGTHHAREWPSAEMPMEFAVDLVRSFGTDPQVTDLVRRVRTIVVPVVNPDGYNLSREAPVDLRALGTAGPVTRAVVEALAPTGIYGDIDRAGLALTGVGSVGSIVRQYGSNTGGTSAILIDAQTQNFAYKRRNCRMAADQAPAPGECALPKNRARGTDPNRNYGGFWGGPGASTSPTVDTYRGTAPFSEPETQNVRALVSSRQVATLITNHTYSNLVLRPPGIAAEGLSPDEPIYKALGDAMGDATGFSSQYGWQLYDTTGTTEDWSYYQTGGLGFTFEIGPHEFHPPYEQVVAEYEGKQPTPADTVAGEPKNGGLRAAYLLAMQNTANTERHGVLKGRAPKGAQLAVTRTGNHFTSDVVGSNTGPLTLTDTVTSSMTVPRSGLFEWHVNPSTRPYAKRDRGPRESTPVSSQAIGGGPLPPTNLIPVEVKEGDPHFFLARAAGQTATDDYDMYLYTGDAPDPRKLHASSATSSNSEQIVLESLQPGRYTLEVRNYDSLNGWSGAVERYDVDASRGLPAQTEAWTVTCRSKDGALLGTAQAIVDRGQTLDVSSACGMAPPKPPKPPKSK